MPAMKASLPLAHTAFPSLGNCLGFKKLWSFLLCSFFTDSQKKKALSIPILVKHHVLCCIAAASSLGPPDQQTCMQQTPPLPHRREEPRASWVRTLHPPCLHSKVTTPPWGGLVRKGSCQLSCGHSRSHPQEMLQL